MRAELPDDLNDWPGDPFELLGIECNADLNTAKRAYVRLIKKFKPDKYPAQFQRIHQAYESVQCRINWHRVENEFNQHETPQSHPLEGNPASTTPASPRFDSQEKNSFFIDKEEIKSPSVEEHVARFHQRLHQGELGAAEAILLSAGENFPLETGRVGFLLYSLKKCQVEPPVSENAKRNIGQTEPTEADRERIGHLIKAFHSEAHFSMAMENLTVEFDRKPSLAILPEINGLVQTLENPFLVSSLLQIRWKAWGYSDWNLVIDDVYATETKLMFAGGVRDHLLAESLEYSVWYAERRCQEFADQTFQELSSSRNDFLLDATEILMLAAQQWKTIQFDSPWISAIPLSRVLLPETHLQYWRPIAEEISQNPTKSLEQLSRLFQRFPFAMMIFEQGLRRYRELMELKWGQHRFEGTDDDRWDYQANQDFLREQVACFFNCIDASNYRNGRHEILEFCSSLQIHPLEFGRIATTFQPDNSLVTWTQLIHEDGALQCLYDASGV